MVETRTLVDEKLKIVLNAMARTGFEVKQPVEVMVDENLPFMGYTSRQWQKHTIVVSGFAVRSPMLEGLLTHELSHVYRNITNHPSHNERIIESVAAPFAKRHNLHQDYELEVLHQVINHIQDLYADDITIKALASNRDTQSIFATLGQFFLDWIKERPEKSASKEKDAWVNAGILLSNCFAVSNIQRRGLSSYFEKAELLNGRFLLKIDRRAKSSFSYFNHFMTNLREDVTEDEYRNQLAEYLEHVYAVTKII
jgi:hypothetical protein